MKIYAAWENCLQSLQTQEDYKKFWDHYLAEEKKIYEKLLGEKTTILEGTVQDLSPTFEVEPLLFAGFLDGINTSLKEPLALAELEDDAPFQIEIDHSKLFFNMLDAKAKWLHSLPAWNDILTEEEQKAIKKDYKDSKTVVKSPKIGRNEPCPCGSGKKYKKCCGKNE